MALFIAVHPLAPTLDMYGESDPSAAYSLSGHVSISVSSSFEQTTARFLLQSVSLTFEGISEVFTTHIGYSSLRLCSISRELAPSEPTELSDEGSGETCIWNLIFNLPIPGWLPPTTALSTEDIGIRYSLYATATYTILNDDQTSWGFASLCTHFRSRVKSVHGQTEIQLCRFISPPRADTLELKFINYLVDSRDSTSISISSKPRVPVEVLNKIQVLASVPEYVNVEDHTLPVALRMRTKDLCEEDCRRLQVTELVVDILQREKCRVRPSSRCLLQYPVPPQEMQPPNLPLLDPHPLSSMYDVGLLAGTSISGSVGRTFSLLPSKSRGTYQLPKDNYAFANDSMPQEVPTWYTLEALLPFVKCSPATAKADEECPEWPGLPHVLPSMSSPLYSVCHDVSILLTCAFDLPSGEIAYEQLKFTVPITFATVAPNLPPVRTWTPPPVHSPNCADDTALFLPYTPASPPVLPAYSQLYDFNGERKIDYSTPLPLYSPRSSIETVINISSTSTSPSNVYHDHHDLNMKIDTPLLIHDSDAVEVPVAI